MFLNCITVYFYKTGMLNMFAYNFSLVKIFLAFATAMDRHVTKERFDGNVYRSRINDDISGGARHTF